MGQRAPESFHSWQAMISAGVEAGALRASCLAGTVCVWGRFAALFTPEVNVAAVMETTRNAGYANQYAMGSGWVCWGQICLSSIGY